MKTVFIAQWTDIYLTTQAICDGSSWLRIRWDVKAVTPNTSLEVMAELSQSVFNVVFA